MSNTFTFRGVQFQNVENYRRDGDTYELREEAFPGVDGVIVIRMGFRGEDISFEGWVDDPLDTDTFLATVRALVDGQAGTLADRTGNITNVICTGANKFAGVGVDSGFHERYRVTFRRVL